MSRSPPARRPPVCCRGSCSGTTASDAGISPICMNRLEATRLVVDAAREAPIVASLGHPAYDLFAAGDRPQNFYTWGSMGLASSIGLGLAVARPDLRVFVIDGD